MQISLSSGKYKIINSGQTFLFADSNELKIEVDADNSFKFSICLKFENDDMHEQKINSVIREDEIILTCVNFKNSGTGLYKPVHIATIDGKALWFVFWSYLEGSLEGKVRSVKYTFFVSDDLEEVIGE